MSSTCLSNETLNPIHINIGVIGLSGPSQVKGASGVGKSSLCNRLVRPHQYNKQISTLTAVDFYSDIINASHWIYWDYVVKTVENKPYAFHIIEETILINEQTYAPFDNFSESDYISRAISGTVHGSKRAYICPSQFSKAHNDKEASFISEETNIDAFLIVYDVSEVNSRDYQAQDRFVTEILSFLSKTKKPLIIVTTKTDLSCSKIRSRLDSILDRKSFKSLPVIETSAKFNINISVILTAIGLALNSNNNNNNNNNNNSGSSSIGNQKFLAFKHFPVKFDSYEIAARKQNEIVNGQRLKFNQLVKTQIEKHYELSWTEFCSGNDLSQFFAIIDRIELQNQYEIFKCATIKKINDSIVDMYVLLFKSVVYEFIDSFVDENKNFTDNITNSLLNNPQFMSRFDNGDSSYEEILKTSHISSQISFPLPRFLITAEHQCNKLKIIESCFDEIKYQKHLSKFSQEFLYKLEENSKLYLEMSFNDVYNKFQGIEMWNEFRVTAEMIFSEFLEKSTKKFKEVFDEKLLELSFMIYSIEPMKTSIEKDSKRKKLPTENILDMKVIKSIDSKIYFDNDYFNREFFAKNRTKWIVKYIGSILSTNPDQCYIFDFRPEACCAYLNRYLGSDLNYFDSLVAVISGDKHVDEIWRDNLITKVDLNLVMAETTSSSPIQFCSSTDLDSKEFWENRFHPCQKVIFLFSENSVLVHNLLDRLLNEEIVNTVQLSVINLAKPSSTSNNKLINQLVKNFNVDYCNIGWSLCVGQNLQKLINEQSNSFLFHSEPVIIWLIVMCLDTYDMNIPLTFFLSAFSNYIIIEKHNLNGLLSLTLVCIPPETPLPLRINISIVSYHQAIKYLTEYEPSTLPHLLIYFCNLFRLASINTMFAVMQNLFNFVSIKSIMCAVACSGNHNTVDVAEQRSMVERLASDSNVDCIVIEDNEESNETNLCKLWTCISYYYSGFNVDENKNFGRYNDAFLNDEAPNLSSLKINSEHSKSCAKYRDDCGKENSYELKPYYEHSQVLSRSNSDIAYCYACSHVERYNKHLEFDCADFQFSKPLGCYNEDEFQPIKEEFNFNGANEIEDKTTIVHINCKNIEHRERSPERLKQTKLSKKPLTSKTRSFSGPVQTNKPFSRKSSGSQGQGHRLQRFTKKSQSLTTSPLTSGIKPISQCDNCKGEIECFACSNLSQTSSNQISTSTSGKSKKSIFSRLFSSERYNNNKCTEERPGFFRRSFKFSKRNSDRKSKSNSVKSVLENQSAQTMSDIACLPLSYSSSQSFTDVRKKSKSTNLLKNL